MFIIKKIISKFRDLTQSQPELVKKITASFKLAEEERQEKSLANKAQSK
jgi:hypothetical protein